MGFYIHGKNRLPQLANYILLLFLLLVLLPESGGAPPKRTYCDDCRKPHDDLPFYCGIKPDLPQCNSPICPKFCDVLLNNDQPYKRTKEPSTTSPIPTPSPKRHRHRRKNRSKVNGTHKPKSVLGRAQSASRRAPTSKRKKGIKLATYVSLGRTQVGKPYNPATCQLNSPNLRRLRPDSKYIEYRPPDSRHQIRDIYDIARRYGLVMAEFRHLNEWLAVEQSSIMQTVSNYDRTLKQPRIYYAIGLSEEEGRERPSTEGNYEGEIPFKYLSDKSSVTFAVMDPNGLGRTDEKCAVLTHAMGSDRQHLTTRLFNCNASLGDGTSVGHGLFMFPPASVCYRRSGEECGLLEQIQSGDDKTFHNMIQIGQTIKRFIYLYTDQMTWSDSKAFCEAKGLHLLDLDPIWEDGPEVAEVMGHFLREGKLNPSSMFWTSGRFQNHFTDGKFRWATTNSEFSTSNKTETPEFPFSWWDDDQLDELKDKPDLYRRNMINKPCVAFAVNSENGGKMHKLLFGAWYCNFPMSFLCYKELTESDKLDDPNPPSKKSRPDPSPDSCDAPPEPGKDPDKDRQTERDLFQPFDKETCTSKSFHVKRLTPNSKFVQYQPTEKHYPVEEIKEHCKRFGLIPSEVRSREDWDSISKWGTGSLLSNSPFKYNYVIGMDDTKEAGKIRYNSDDGELTFSMFTGDGSSSNNHRCTVLTSSDMAPRKVHGLFMKHVNCKKVFLSEDEIVYGLCMFPLDWNCYKESDEEIAELKDKAKYATLISLGGTDTRDIFFNPVQRNWTGALKFCQAVDLQLLDFDEKWNDAQQVRNIFRDKLQEGGGLSPFTPLWTSGKLQGPVADKIGKWSSTNSPLKFPLGTNYKWPHLDDLYLGQRRETSIHNACVEGSFDDSTSNIRLRPHYCDLPKYFLCYRKSDKVGGKGSSKHDGITVFLDEPDASDEKDVGGGGAGSRANNGIGRNNKNYLPVKESKVRLKFRQ